MALNTRSKETAPERAAGRRRARPLEEAEIEELLQRLSWGVLSTSVDGQPYAVPVVYGWDGSAFYVLNGPGRKVENMEANPRVCLTIADVEGKGERWRSVVVEGKVEWVGVGGMLHAADVVRRQLGDYVPSARDAAAFARARVIRIVPLEMTGRTVGF